LVVQLARKTAAARAAIDRPRVMKALGIGARPQNYGPGRGVYLKPLIT
jgi:hypothetical protein